MPSGSNATLVPVQPLTEADLRYIHPEEVHSGNLVSARVAPAIMDHAGHRVQMTPVPIARARDLPLTDPAVVYASCDGAPAILVLPRAFLDMLAMSLEPSLQLDTLAPKVRAAVIEHVLTPYLEKAQAVGFPMLQLHEVDFAPVMPDRFDMAALVSIDNGIEWPLLIGADAALTGRLIALAHQLPARPLQLNAIALKARFRIGYTILPRKDLMQLRRGDGILFDNSVLRQHQVVITIAERYAQKCSVTPTGMLLSGSLLTLAAPDLRGYCMNDSLEASAEDPVLSLQAMPMKLIFELGRLDISLGDLRQLGEGHVFELNKARVQAVDLVVANHIVGTGEIVRIGEHIGVRVVTIAET